MSRLRFAAFLLTGVALAACSSGSSDPASMTLNARPGETEMSGDLDVQIRRAQLLRTQGNFTEATRALSQMMIAVPDDPRVVSEYGKLLAQKGQPQDAIQFLRRASELNPTDWTLWSAMGVAYDQINDPNTARIAYDRALSLKPNDPSILNNYAMSRMLAHDLPQAARLIYQAKLAGGSDPRIQKNAEMIASLMPQQQSSQPTSMPVAQGPVSAPVTPVARSQAPVMTAPLASAQQPYVSMPVQQRPMPSQPVASQDRQPSGAPRSLQPQASANSAPVKLANVRMMEVPVDPLAGPVANRIKLKPPARTAVAKAEPSKPAKTETKTAKAELPSSISVTPEKLAKPVKTEVARNDAPKTDAKKPEVKAASAKPAPATAKPDSKPAAKPQKPQFADSQKDGGIPRLRMASDSSEP